MKYYTDLVNDKKRVQAFTDAINQKAHGVVYDLGTGSGILAVKARKKASKVYAVEQNPLVVKKTGKELGKYGNIRLICADAVNYEFTEDPDTVICEMLDTALIDEEQVPVINNAVRYKKSTTTFIPEQVYTTAQLVNTNIKHVTYYENNHPRYETLTDAVKYSCVDFTNKITPLVDENIKFNIKKTGHINAVLLTTYTRLTDTITIAPTPMMNPPLIIPLSTVYAQKDETFKVSLKYIMGGGLDTIKTSIEKY